MSRKTPAPVGSEKPTAVAIAERLCAGLADDADFAVQDAPVQVSGLGEPGAMFHVSPRGGRGFRVRVIPL